jgi:hypothetical protein
MSDYTRRAPRRKHEHNIDIDDGTDAERAVVIIATRFALPLNVARLIAHHAGLGGQR